MENNCEQTVTNIPTDTNLSQNSVPKETALEAIENTTPPINTNQNCNIPDNITDLGSAGGID